MQVRKDNFVLHYDAVERAPQLHIAQAAQNAMPAGQGQPPPPPASSSRAPSTSCSRPTAERAAGGRREASSAANSERMCD